MADQYGVSPIHRQFGVWLRESQDTPELWAEYHKLHSACPACGTNGVEQTCIGIIGPPPDRVNRCRCACGWRGVVDDLKPAPE
jgi:hypothetical protein